MDDRFYRDVKFVRSTAFTNVSITLWNKHIRKVMFPQDGELLTKDDLLTAYKTVIDDNNNVILINGQDYIIDDLSLYKNSYGINTYCVILKNISTGKNTQMLQILNSNNNESTDIYLKILTKLRDNAKTTTKAGRWLPFFKFKNATLAMNDYSVGGQKLPKELDYGYCITVHKLQGSTLDNIFVDGLDICKPMTKWGKRMPADIDTRNRLLYVALSRAKYKAYIKF